MYQETSQKRIQKTIVRKFSNILILTGAIICVIASFVHIGSPAIQDDLLIAKEESSNAIKKRKEAHSKLLDAVFNYSDGEISQAEYSLIHAELVNNYREAKLIASEKIAIKNDIASTYKINNFQNLEQFLYGLGQGVTIFFAGVIILLLSFKISGHSRRFGILASTAVISVGSFWIAWALFQNGDYSKIVYYVIVLCASSLITISLWYLLRSIKTTNEKIQQAISFSLRARKSLYAYFDNSPKKAPHKTKEQFDNDLYNTLDELSK